MAAVHLRLVAGDNPVTPRFSDQLVAVLPRLRRFARGLTGSVMEADDLVQAACER
ncbi:MAG: sigma factor, partial [Stellaceae bacterium]